MEQQKGDVCDSFLMVNVGDGEICIEEIPSLNENNKALGKISILNEEPVINEIPKKSSPANFVFQKRYLQWLLLSSGVVSGLILAYDLKYHQSLETRDLIAGINGVVSIAGLSYFSNYCHKKEKVDDENLLKP